MNENVGSFPLATIIVQSLQMWFNLLGCTVTVSWLGFKKIAKLIFKCLGQTMTCKMHLNADHE